MTERIAAQRWAGADILRIAATALVFVQHTLSITDHDSLSAVFGLRSGRLGTALFFAIGGYFAAATTRSPEAWLGQRLRTLLPPYWIVLAASLVGVWLTQHKPFDAWQVLCQFAGVGLFTHPDRLVNVSTWFISAIVLLYLAVFLARRTSERVGIGLALAACVCLGTCWPERFGWTWFAAVFFVAYSIPLLGFGLARGALACAGVLAIAALAVPALRYGAVALLLLAAGSCWQRSWRPAETLGEYSYDCFLVHGPALHIAWQLAGDNVWMVALLGAAITCCGIIVLRHLTYLSELAARSVLSQLRRFPLPAPRTIVRG